MSKKKPKATRRRMISCFAQIINQYVPGYKIEEFAKEEKLKARVFSYGSQAYLLMLSQFLHLFSLNELVDVSKIYQPELSRIRGILPWIYVTCRTCPYSIGYTVFDKRGI